eukprot:gb/GEZN01004198.1/.p1 GENE.gb/GEZN01004198.1/~~gb/GEZN01004198.1/.p1  ORF type:complete len:476 (+),score=41.59 gb/GEZN01004198.1/:212-1639(+)
MVYFPDTAADYIARERSEIVKAIMPAFPKQVMHVLQEYMGPPPKQIDSDMVAEAPLPWREAIYKGLISGQPLDDTVAKLVVSGVPDGFRSFLWSNLLNVSMISNPGVFSKVLEMSATKVSEGQVTLILQDIPQTFPKHPYFAEKKSASRVDISFNGKERLSLVLRALAAFDKDFSYSTGINYLAGFLLLYMNEEAVFWSLVSLLRKSSHFSFEHNLPVSPKPPSHRRQSSGIIPGLRTKRLPCNTGRNLLPPRLRDLYPIPSDSAPLFEVQEYSLVLIKLLDTVDAKLSKHLQKSPDLLLKCVVGPWFKTVFTIVLPLPHCARIMDMFLLEGIAILFTVAVALLQHESSHLLPKDPAGPEIEQYLNSLSARPVSLPSAELLINQAMKFVHPRWFQTWLESRKSVNELDQSKSPTVFNRPSFNMPGTTRNSSGSTAGSAAENNSSPNSATSSPQAQVRIVPTNKQPGRGVVPMLEK